MSPRLVLFLVGKKRRKEGRRKEEGDEEEERMRRETDCPMLPPGTTERVREGLV